MRHIYDHNGMRGFWKGIEAKMLEASLKGGILMWAKETSLDIFDNMGMDRKYSGFLGGGIGGVAQVSVMGPCTMFVTMCVVNRDPNVPVWKSARSLLAEKGIK